MNDYDDLTTAAARRAHAVLGAALPTLAEADRLKVRMKPLAPAPPSSFLGLSEREIRQYSIAQAIQDTVSERWKHGTFEAACHDALTKQRHGAASGRSTGGFLVPWEIQHRSLEMTRADTVGVGSSGGYLVGTKVLSFIDELRNRIVALRLGGKELPMGGSNASIPKLTGSATTSWLGTETTQVGQSGATLSQLNLTPKNIAGYTELSRQLILQSPQAADIVINTDLPRALAVAVDAVAIAGTGTSGQPVGITNLQGTNSVTGTSIALSGMTTFQVNAGVANSDGSTFAYVTTPTIAGVVLKQRQQFSGSSLALWQGNAFDSDDVCGCRGMSSQNVPSGTLIGGPWGDCVIATWQDLEIVVNPYNTNNFMAGIVGVSAFLSVDVGFRYPAAWTISTGVT